MFRPHRPTIAEHHNRSRTRHISPPRRNEVTRIPRIGHSYRGSWPFVGRIELEITDLNNVYLERELLRVENWGAATLGSTPEPTNHCSKRPRSVPRAITLATSPSPTTSPRISRAANPTRMTRSVPLCRGSVTSASGSCRSRHIRIFRGAFTGRHVTGLKGADPTPQICRSSNTFRSSADAAIWPETR